MPLDGTVVEGQASIMMDHITGESLPIYRQEGDEIAAGSRNTDGVLVVETTEKSQDSTPAKIARLAAQAQVSSGTCQGSMNWQAWPCADHKFFGARILFTDGLISLIPLSIVTAHGTVMSIAAGGASPTQGGNAADSILHLVFTVSPHRCSCQK